MPIDSITKQRSLTRSSSAPHLVGNAQAPTNELRLQPSTTFPSTSEQLPDLPQRHSTDGGASDFASPSSELQTPAARTEEPSAIRLARKRALGLQEKAGPLEKAKNADEAMALADVLVAELFPPIATPDECFELESELWDLNRLKGADEIKRLGDGPYLQLVNAIMRYKDANHPEEAEPASVAQPNQRAAYINDLLQMIQQARRVDTRYLARELVADTLRTGVSMDQAVATAVARYSLTHPDDLNALRQIAVDPPSNDGARANVITQEWARLSMTNTVLNGVSVEQAVATTIVRFGLTHADDLNELRQIAVGLASNDGQPPTR
jgi:hypothetical protein